MSSTHRNRRARRRINRTHPNIILVAQSKEEQSTCSLGESKTKPTI